MDTWQLILLISLAAAMLAWGAAQLMIDWCNDDHRKISRRLNSDGHSEVDTLLGRRNATSVVLQIKGLPPVLARSSFCQNLNRKLIQAYPDASLVRLLGICGLLAVIGFVLVASVMESLLAGLVGGTVLGYLPLMFINARRGRRQRQIAGQIPDALDFLCRILKAGHSLATGIQMMGDELPAPIGIEFRRCYDQHSLGQPLEQALRDMSVRVESADFAFFITAILIQRQTGGDLGEVLRNISTMIRARVKLQQHVKAITAEGRLTGYILFAFPAVLFTLSWFLNPAYASILLKTDTGRMLLGLAFALQMTGLVVIRKIVNVKA
ncbi:MAG: type II secretion system F family protein [Tepidisphaeraceae bacterium]